MNVQAEQYDAQLVGAIGVAIGKARELGYDVEAMSVKASVADRTCTVYFEPVPEPGSAILGGDLTVDVNLDTKEIVKFERGQ